MDFFDVVERRRSIRKYLSKEVPDEILKKIIGAANMAPSALNQQPWEFVVVKDKELKRKIREIYIRAREKLDLYKQDTDFLENATLIIALADKNRGSSIISTAMAAENMILAVTALDLGANCMTSPIVLEEDTREIRQIFSIPEKYEIVLLIALGYSDEKPELKPKKPAEELTHYNRFSVK